MEEAKIKAKIEFELKIHPENLELLKSQKFLLKKNKREDIKRNIEDLEVKWEEIQKFCMKIKNFGNPLENNEPLNIDELEEWGGFLMLFFNKLHETRLMLFDLENDVSIRDKAIEINIKIVGKKAQIAAQEAGDKLLESIIGNISKMIDDLDTRLITYIAKDLIC